MKALLALKVGDLLPGLQVPPISRTTIGIYAGASGDFNPMHIDVDAARKAGFDDVFVHGMLCAAYLLRVLTSCVPLEFIKEYRARFTSMTQVHDQPHCGARVCEVREENGQRIVRLDVECSNAGAEIRIVGSAVIAFPLLKE